MSSEKLELVTDFASLGAGMIVVCKCFCGRDHRTILTNRGECPRDGECFVISPSPCFGTEIHIGPSAVKARNVWRVVDGLKRSEDADLVAAGTPKERP